MAIELSSDNAICSKCGTAFSRRKGYFPVSYAVLHKGIGHIPVCKTCIDSLYNEYLSQCGDSKYAVRQVCRKLDLFWSDSVFDMISKKSTSRTMMTQYIAKINTSTYLGKSYDDTLSAEGTLWSFIPRTAVDGSLDFDPQDNQLKDVDKDIIKFWGAGYTPEMYIELESRKDYYEKKYGIGHGTSDMGEEILIRQICLLEVNIARESAAGRPIDKLVNSLNTILGSLNIKPAQKDKSSDDDFGDKPMGVWIREWETKRPIPEPDPEFQDVDGIIKYISIWFLGHLCKMLNIRNSYCKLYEDEIAKRKVDRPEYEAEDDEVVFNDIFGENEE